MTPFLQVRPEPGGDALRGGEDGDRLSRLVDLHPRWGDGGQGVTIEVTSGVTPRSNRWSYCTGVTSKTPP